MPSSAETLNTLDISRFLSGQSTPEQDRALAAAFIHLAKDVGFFYVEGYEPLVPQELVDEVFQYVRASLFTAPRPFQQLDRCMQARARRA